jgi:hypothetical protein
MYQLLFDNGYSFLFESKEVKKPKEFKAPMGFKFNENNIEE